MKKAIVKSYPKREFYQQPITRLIVDLYICFHKITSLVFY